VSARRALGAGPARDALDAGSARAESVRAAQLRVWAPIALRALALGIALLGLAGIGSAVGRTPISSPSPGVSHAELGFGALSARALAVISSAGSPPSPPPRPEPAPAPPGAGRETKSAAPVAPDASSPCPESRREHAGRGRREPKAPGTSDAQEMPKAPVILNRAEAAELRRLPGVGAKRAEAILALRQRLGRFRRPSDLLRVKGIGPRTLERMLPHLVLD
jgi:competence protein ComEA